MLLNSRKSCLKRKVIFLTCIIHLFKYIFLAFPMSCRVREVVYPMVQSIRFHFLPPGVYCALHWLGTFALPNYLSSLNLNILIVKWKYNTNHNAYIIRILWELIKWKKMKRTYIVWYLNIVCVKSRYLLLWHKLPAS